MLTREFIPVYVSGLLFSLPVIVLFDYAPWFASSLGVGYLQVGLVSTAYFVANILGSYLWGGLSDVWRNRKLLPVLSGIGYPVCLFFLSIVTSEENRGAFMGLIYVFYGIGGIMGPVIMGGLLGYLGYFPMGVIMALFSFFGLVLGVLKVEETLSGG